jgi:hypothetical protein
MLGLSVGDFEGDTVGLENVGFFEGLVVEGVRDGEELGFELDGDDEGFEVVGALLGEIEGLLVEGDLVGDRDGCLVIRIVVIQVALMDVCVSSLKLSPGPPSINVPPSLFISTCQPCIELCPIAAVPINLFCSPHSPVIRENNQLAPLFVSSKGAPTIDVLPS